MIHQSLTRSLSKPVLCWLCSSVLASPPMPPRVLDGLGGIRHRSGSGVPRAGNDHHPTATVNVTYTNAQGIGFYQPSGGTDFGTSQSRFEFALHKFFS